MENSHQWIDAILSRLFEAENRYVENMVTELNRSNCAIKCRKFYGFMHMGRKFIAREYRNLNPRLITTQKIPTLDFSLWDQAAEFTKHLSRIDLDKAQIKQVLFKLLCQCNNLQEIRDVLPECLISFVPEVKDMKREHQDSLYMMRSDKLFLDQYQRILPKIEFYTMSRMMY